MDNEIEVIEAEQCLLGMVLWKGKPIEKAISLKKDDFLLKEHQMIWQAIKSLYKRGEGINNILVYEESKKLKHETSPEYQKVLLDGAFCPEEDGLIGMVRLIKESSIQRKIMNGIEVKADDLKELFIPDREKTETYDAKELAVKEINSLLDGKHMENLGYTTRWQKLNRYIGGLKKGDLIILAGRPSMGKTSFAINLAVSLAERGTETLYINLEMTANQIIQKVISLLCKINSDKFNNFILETEAKEFFAAGNYFVDKKLPLKILDASKISLSEIKEYCQKTQCKALFIDQLLKVKRETKRDRFDQEIADITLGLKCLAKELNIPIILLHQINRGVEARIDKRPCLSDLRDSGAVEQDGDIILLLYREGYYSMIESDKTAIVRVAKNKMGRQGDIDFTFEPSLGKFEEVNF